MKKRTIIIIILVIVSYLIGQQVFRYIKYEGNLIVYISNQSEQDSVNIELFLDGKKVLTDMCTNETFHNYKIHPFKTSLGKHTIIVKSNGIESKEVTYTVLFMKWVIVDFVENDDLRGNDEKYMFIITTQSSPLLIR